jgi:hypothetical protein
MTIVCSEYMVLLYKYYVVNLKLYCTSILNINYNTYVQDSQLRIESSNTDKDRDGLTTIELKYSLRIYIGRHH